MQRYFSTASVSDGISRADPAESHSGSDIELLKMVVVRTGLRAAAYPTPVTVSRISPFSGRYWRHKPLSPLDHRPPRIRAWRYPSRVTLYENVSVATESSDSFCCNGAWNAPRDTAGYADACALTEPHRSRGRSILPCYKILDGHPYSPIQPVTQGTPAPPPRSKGSRRGTMRDDRDRRRSSPGLGPTAEVFRA